jgi:hypothetical protein
LRSTYTPVWNESFNFDVKTDVGPGPLSLFVMDWNRLEKHQLIGIATIPEADLIALSRHDAGHESGVSLPVIKDGKPVVGHDAAECVLRLKLKVVEGLPRPVPLSLSGSQAGRALNVAESLTASTMPEPASASQLVRSISCSSESFYGYFQVPISCFEWG